MNFKKKNWIIIGIIALFLISNVITFFIAKNYNIFNTDGFEKLIQLEKIIESQYYQDIDRSVLVEGAVKGMFFVLGDQYSEYYTKDEFDNFSDMLKNNYEGIGVSVTETKDKNAIIVQVFENSPAASVGIKPGDLIQAVDDESMQGKGLNYSVSKMKGPENTSVKITILRNDQTIDMYLKRAKIHISNIQSEMIQDIGYISITEISEAVSEDFKNHLEKLLSDNAKGIIIDLRFNGGGLLDEAYCILDRILKKDQLAVYLVDKNGKRKDYYSISDDFLNVPLVVLVNENTASASEIISGAIQDHQIGKIVGTQTFGKGVVQFVYNLKDGSGCKITTAHYYTPSGNDINNKGITPDYVIEQSAEYQYMLNTSHNQDIQLQKAIEIIKAQYK